MTEPSSPVLLTALVALATSALGPLLGPYTLIVIASTAGAFVAAAEAHTNSRREVFVYVLRGALFATAFAALTADWAERHWSLPGYSALAGVSVLIGYQAHQVHRLIPLAVRRIFRRPDPHDRTD